MNFNDLTPELQEKVRACENTDELIELAKSEGVELTDEQLEMAGGGYWETGECTRKGCMAIHV